MFLCLFPECVFCLSVVESHSSQILTLGCSERRRNVTRRVFSDEDKQLEELASEVRTHPPFFGVLFPCTVPNTTVILYIWSRRSFRRPVLTCTHVTQSELRHEARRAARAEARRLRDEERGVTQTEDASAGSKVSEGCHGMAV